MSKVTILIDGKQREMKYTYDAIDYIEETFDSSVFKVFKDKDVMRQSTQRKLLYAAVLHENNVESEEEFVSKIKKDANEGKIDTMEIVEKITQAFSESQPLQKAFNEGKKIQAKQQKTSA